MTLNVVIEVEFKFKDKFGIMTTDKTQLIGYEIQIYKIKEEKNFLNLLELHYYFLIENSVMSMC